PEAFDPDAITIEPELPRRRIHVSGNYMTIEGMSKGRTTYEVTLPAALVDTFGQALGDDEELTFQVGDAHPQLFARTGLVIADPSAKKPTYDVHSINIPSLDVTV